MSTTKAVLLALSAMLVGAAAGLYLPSLWPAWRPPWEGPVHIAVLLTSGEAYYGRPGGRRDGLLRLDDVYYIRRGADGEGQTQFVLTRRGGEWHSPAEMYVSVDQILFLEPIAPDSRVGKMISEAQKTPR